MKDKQQKNRLKFLPVFNKLVLFAVGFGALLWFLIRVIPKPSRAAYPCQRAAFPLASAFVMWLMAVFASWFGIKHLGKIFSEHRWIVVSSSVLAIVVLSFWVTIIPSGIYESAAAKPDTTYIPSDTHFSHNWVPGASNTPVGEAKGIFPGRVVMTRNPEATKWAGNWNVDEDQWWLDKNTDVEKVGEMLSVTVQKITGTKNDKSAWNKIFEYHNKNSRGLKKQGYRPGEKIAIKINLNNSPKGLKTNNMTDASPQMVLATIRQLVNEAGVREKDILVYDARRQIYAYMISSVWKEFPDVHFVQVANPEKTQPLNPKYGDYTGLDSVLWVQGVSYSKDDIKECRFIPEQVMNATYLINLAILKLHSYPYNYMEVGLDGQTALTMSSKNHFGSIKQPWEIHKYLNTHELATPNSYSPFVDIEASPNLGAKTILYLLDGLYCGRRWECYPLHFPNPPFNNKVVPYENPEWPACLLGSFDPVAIQSVGLDIMYAQSKNNFEASYHNVPRIAVRENADDFLLEMANPENPPSGTKYMLDGKPIKSLGVFEHWDDDATMQYSRNIDPKNGKGIEFLYFPLGSHTN